MQDSGSASSLSRCDLVRLGYLDWVGAIDQASRIKDRASTP